MCWVISKRDFSHRLTQLNTSVTWSASYCSSELKLWDLKLLPGPLESQQNYLEQRVNYNDVVELYLTNLHTLRTL